MVCASLREDYCAACIYTLCIAQYFMFNIEISIKDALSLDIVCE